MSFLEKQQFCLFFFNSILQVGFYSKLFGTFIEYFLFIAFIILFALKEENKTRTIDCLDG